MVMPLGSDPNVSLVDLTVQIENQTSVEEVHSAMKEASETSKRHSWVYK